MNAAVIDETATFFKHQEEGDVVVRGLYDVTGFRADADYMIWTHAERVEDLPGAAGVPACGRQLRFEGLKLGALPHRRCNAVEGCERHDAPGQRDLGRRAAFHVYGIGRHLGAGLVGAVQRLRSQTKAVAGHGRRGEDRQSGRSEEKCP